jgi:translation initiation factor 4E
MDDKTRLDRLWEQLVFALIGEEFEDPDVVGIVVQIRVKEDVLSVWLADKAPKFRVGEKLKQILHLGPSTVIEYKNNRSSMKDHSGLRNAQAYYVGEENEGTEEKAES